MYIPTPGLEKALEGWWSRWIRRGRTGPAPYAQDGSGWILVYTARYRLTACLKVAGFSALDVFGVQQGLFRFDTWRDRFVLVGSVVLWLVCAAVLVRALIERITVTPQHLRRRSWIRRQEVAWADANMMTIDARRDNLKIGVEGGTVIEVSLYLDGLHALADALDRHFGVPADVMDGFMPSRTAQGDRRT